MDWSNEKTLYFIELLQSEPALWDPRNKAHKIRAVQNDAWHRILQKLPVEVTAEELKKKKESLMGYYRTHLNKYKKSLKSGAGGDDVYTTNWFAFDAMHAFLEPIYYAGNITLNAESQSSIEQSEDVFQSRKSIDQSERVVESASPLTSPPQFQVKHGANKQPSSSFSNHITLSGQCCSDANEFTLTKQQMDETCHHLKSLSNKEPRHDQFYHFGAMIAAKIRNIDSFAERETLMNDIHNRVFQSVMRNKNAIISNQPLSHYVMPSDITQQEQQEQLLMKSEIVVSANSPCIFAEEQPVVTSNMSQETPGVTKRIKRNMHN